MNQFGESFFEEPSPSISASTTTAQTSAPVPDQTDFVNYYSKVYPDVDYDFSVNTEFEARAVHTEAKLARPEALMYLINLYGSIDAMRSDCATILTGFPTNIPIAFTPTNMDRLRSVPQSMIAAFLSKKREISTIYDQLALFRSLLEIPEVKVTAAGDRYLLTMGDTSATFNPFTYLFVDSYEAFRNVVATKKGVTLVVSDPPTNLVGSLRHLLSVYQMSYTLEPMGVRFSFIKRNFPNMPPIDPSLLGPNNSHLVDDYIKPISDALNGLKLPNIPPGITTAPEQALLTVLMAKYGRYDRIPVIIYKNGGPVDFAAISLRLSAQWREVTTTIKSLTNKPAVDAFLAKNTVLVASCLTKLDKSRAYRMLHTSMDKATHRSLSLIPGSECMDDAFDATLKDIYLVDQYLSRNPKVSKFVVIGAELSMLKVLTHYDRPIYAIDTLTPANMLPEVKMITVDSLFSLTAAQLANKVGGADNALFILCKGPVDVQKKVSAFQQNLDLYSWFFSLPWLNCIARVYFPGLDIPSVLRPALTRSGFLMLDAGRLHNDECFFLFGGAPYTERGIIGNYTFGVVRAAYMIHKANDVRNAMCHNGIAILARSFAGQELILNKALSILRPQVVTARGQVAQMEFDFDFVMGGTDESERSKRKESETVTPAPPPAENRMVLRNPNANYSPALSPLPSEPEEEREDELEKPRKVPKKAGRGGKK